MKISSITLALLVCYTGFAADIGDTKPPEATAPVIVETTPASPVAVGPPVAPATTAVETVEAKVSSKKDYFESLFDKVEVAKKTPPDIASNKLYDKLAKDSVAYGVLREYPALQMGEFAFRPLSKQATHKPEIRQGQKLIKGEFQNTKPLTYKAVTETIDRKIADPNNSLKDMDWVMMSNAFRTLKAPGESHRAHLLGDFLAEYILLGEIKKQENKTNVTPDDRSFLSTLYYDLSQLYQSMYKNDENLFKKTDQHNLALPIPAVYRPDDNLSPYDQGYNVPYDTLVGRRLDLLDNSLMFDPYDQLAWAQLIDFAAFDLMDPWFFDQFSYGFWGNYFPYGFTPNNARGLQDRWADIRGDRGNFRGLGTSRNHIDRAVRGLSRGADPASRLNTTIRAASSRTGTPAIAASSRAGTPVTAARTGVTANAARVASSRSNNFRSQARASSRHNTFPQVFRALEQHYTTNSFSHGGGGFGHAASGHGGGGVGHTAGSHGGGGGGHSGGVKKK